MLKYFHSAFIFKLYVAFWWTPPNTTSCNESRVIRFYDFLQKNPTCKKNWEQYKKSCMVAMQTLQCLNAISEVSKNWLLWFIYLDKPTAEYQESYLWNTLKWGQRHFKWFPLSMEEVCVCLCALFYYVSSATYWQMQ